MSWTRTGAPATQGANCGNATAEPPIEGKSQCWGRAQESRRAKASIAASATAGHYEGKSQCQGHAQESQRPKASFTASATVEPSFEGKPQCHGYAQASATAEPVCDVECVMLGG